MASTPLLPQTFWFRVAVPCRRIDAFPRAQGRPLDLPDECALPGFARLDEKRPWVDVRVAWNPRGLAVQVEAPEGSGRIVHDQYRTDFSTRLQVWLDARDTRDVHRATRFCHRFVATLIPSGRGKALDVELIRQPIPRALAEPPPSRPEALKSFAERVGAGWRLEVFLGAEAIHGFDPDTNRRLGFAYQISAPGREDQFLGVGREFPVGEDPSLWSTLELQDGPAPEKSKRSK